MNWNQIEGTWKALKTRFGERWGKPASDELGVNDRKRDQLARYTARSSDYQPLRSQFHLTSATDLRQGGRNDVT